MAMPGYGGRTHLKRLPPGRLLCRHCSLRLVARARGLCFNCSRRPDVRELYPTTSKYARRGLGNGCRNAPLPAEPTRAEPGSEAKIAVLMERLARREALHHPGDVRAKPKSPPIVLTPVRTRFGRSVAYLTRNSDVRDYGSREAA